MRGLYAKFYITRDGVQHEALASGSICPLDGRTTAPTWRAVANAHAYSLRKLRKGFTHYAVFRGDHRITPIIPLQLSPAKDTQP